MILLWLYLAGAAVTLAGVGVCDAIMLGSPKKKLSLELGSLNLLVVFMWPVALVVFAICLVVFAIWVLLQLVYIIPAFITCVIIGRIKHKRKEQNK